jgi:hypothetical protein
MMLLSLFNLVSENGPRNHSGCTIGATELTLHLDFTRLVLANWEMVRQDAIAPTMSEAVFRLDMNCVTILHL